MTTEEIQKTNQVRLVNLTLLSLAAGAWDVLGKGVNAFSGPMGDEVLKAMKKDMGLEITGKDPETVLTEISNLFVEKFGFASAIEVATEADGKLQLKVRNCVNRGFTDQLMAAGVEKPFVCPIMNACRSALKQVGCKCHEDIAAWADGQGSVISFTPV